MDNFPQNYVFSPMDHPVRGHLIPRTAAIGGVASGNPLQPHWQQEKEKRLLDNWTTKLARTKRKMARQIRANLKHATRNNPLINHSTYSSSNSSSSSSSTATLSDTVSSRREDHEEVVPRKINETPVPKPDLYSFCTLDNKRLRMLLKKELKNSDVGSLGRIVLPKKEAENKLPVLTNKEGTQVVIKDVHSKNQWALRYKYWLNNKSRMYVLENTGNFVKQNGLEMGDSITLYEDECKNLYATMKKRDKANQSTIEDNSNDNNAPPNDINLHLSSFSCKEIEEDMTSLELLLTQPKEASNGFVAALCHDNKNRVSVSEISCARHCEEEAKCTHESPPSCNNEVIETADDRFFDDCYGGLGMLPEVNQYQCNDYLAMFDPNSE